MTQEEKRQFEELKEKVRNLEQVEDVDFIANLREKIGQMSRPSTFDDSGITGVVDTNTNVRTTTVSITIPSGGGTDTADVTHLSAPDNFLLYKLNGQTYKIWANLA